VVITHPDLQPGSACPSCAAYQTLGRLYDTNDPTCVIRLQGQPFIHGTRFVLQKLRCRVCGEQFKASLPKGVSRSKYDASSRSTVALYHYYLGLPFKRIELAQSMAGIPVADATQWDQMHRLYQQVQPVFNALEQAAAEGNRFSYDDTPNRLLDKTLLSPGRKGVYTTAIAAEDKDTASPIFLFYTSGRYAGENIKSLLQSRQSDEQFIAMSDASSMNLPHAVPESLLANWIFCFCLVHGRRKFYELYDIHSETVRFVLDQIGAIYQHEKQCQSHRYTALERLRYHQRHSAPVLELLKRWLTNQLVFHQQAPNSALYEAIHYLLKYWTGLTQFLRVAGASIDNSLAERLIKVMIRYRKNSLFFKTARGAAVGDALMSIIHTARYSGVAVYDYLTALQEHQEAVAQSPQDWLPWVYAARSSTSASWQQAA